MLTIYRSVFEVVPYEQTKQIILLPVPNLVKKLKYKKLKMLLKMNEKIKIVPGIFFHFYDL